MSKDAALTADEEAVLVAGFAGAVTDVDVLSAADLEDDSPKRKLRPVDSENGEDPKMTDSVWSDFVMRHFSEDELDPNGNPLVHGLRRVTRVILGPIISSKAHVVQAPTMIGGFEKTTLMQPAVVEYTVVVMMCKLEQGMTEAYQVEFTDAADVYMGNTDPDFCRHPTATAATRAEARCLRKALQLRAVAAEELTKVPTEEASVNGFITPPQVNFLNVLCHRNDINLMKYVNSGAKKYSRIEDVPYGTAAKMVEHLSGLQNDPSSVKSNIKGYDQHWRANA